MTIWAIIVMAFSLFVFAIGRSMYLEGRIRFAQSRPLPCYHWGIFTMGIATGVFLAALHWGGMR